ncbi:hypothetical protein Sps_03912 [Shewanella psychrophila]|uniref:Outer membrane protein beta-barrel domain n=1 Tax=Shewanella psychrophila TaxID=225848 RepID=A0A1S6HTY4_9GAMM|nr:hypothetical protein [Shewanella psychrophila]AQS39027.1 hypothetical protein Sps_03912 [Shewanella psychrophila]
MKSVISIIGLLALVTITSSTAIAAPQVGVMIGSDSGINAKFGDIKLGVALDNFSITADKMINFNNPHFYYGFGGKIAEINSSKHDLKLGARAIFGAQTSVEKFTFFLEAQPILYIIDDVKVELEAIAGVRYQF